MSATNYLDSAREALGQRAALRDTPSGERSAARAAAILSAWTGREWIEADVWRCLLAVKLAREVQGRFHKDDYVDLAGYAGLLGECLEGLDNSDCNLEPKPEFWIKRGPE